MNYKALLLTQPSKTINNFWTCSTTSPVGSVMPPCDLVSIAGVLRTQSIKPKILDLRLHKKPFDALLSTINAWKPDSIIINVTTAAAMDVYPVLQAVKDKVSKRIVFGFHAMALPDELFEQGATHVLIGDPEYSVCSAVRGKTSNDTGICTKEIRATKPGWIENLDELPYPALDLIDVNKYHSLLMGREPFSILLANRGCSYQCPYCVIPYQLGNRVRTMSVKRTIGEIERDIREFNIRSFFFIDSAINLKPEWTASLCEEIIRKNLKIRWCSNMRVPPVTRELLQLMKRSGCFRLFYGVEDLDLIDTLKRKTTRQATREAFLLTKEAGIETVAFIILFPGVDQSEKAMADRLVNMVSDLKADALQCNMAIPYPGSQMYEEYKKKYFMSKDWSLYDPSGNAYPYESKLNLVKVRRMVYLRFFLKNPLYVLKTFLRADLRSMVDFIRNALGVLYKSAKINH